RSDSGSRELSCMGSAMPTQRGPAQPVPLWRNIGLLRELQWNGAQEKFAGCEHQPPQTQGDQSAQVALDRIEQVLPRDAARLAALEEEKEEEVTNRMIRL